MAKKKGEVTISVTDLWAIWSKGRATGSMMATAGMQLSDLGMGPANEYAETEMHKDIADVVPLEDYRTAVEESGFSVPRFLK